MGSRLVGDQKDDERGDRPPDRPTGDPCHDVALNRKRALCNRVAIAISMAHHGHSLGQADAEILWSAANVIVIIAGIAVAK